MAHAAERRGVEAEGKGISQSVLDEALAGIQPIPRVIELDRRQPEFTLTFGQYRDRVVPQSRINKGRIKYQDNGKLLKEIGSVGEGFVYQTNNNKIA